MLGHPNTPTKANSSNCDSTGEAGPGKPLWPKEARPWNPRAEEAETDTSLKRSPSPRRGGPGTQEEVETGQQRCLGVFAVMFCGMAGFSDFYKLRWLEAILSWQNPQAGCFGRPGELSVCPSWTHCLVGSQFLDHSGKGCPGTENWWWFRTSRHTQGSRRAGHSESPVQPVRSCLWGSLTRCTGLHKPVPSPFPEHLRMCQTDII